MRFITTMTLLAVTSLVSACADARTTEPFQVSMPGNAPMLASCTYRAANGADDGMDIRLVNLPDIDVIQLTGDLKSFGALRKSFHTWQLNFKPGDSGTTDIQVSDTPTIYGNHYWWRTIVQPWVEECSRKLGPMI